ncbi:WhiB family transcriptional regulator [Actinocrispum wychmicini]|uniref:Transcriptional regulator WhiB n=1 Tax=Actinocrispum wychmicini TaxID=1213861 RepID=A0A4R2JV90_9PSEU|nr:WhiB family transcriptional regulator [Actinocrispum wychmicini]TCO64371.1 transcription factor WhiB [Actinocrispum wychmicini]
MIRLPEWRTRAACRGRLELDFIDPRTPTEAAQCRAICTDCPVREQCLGDALAAGEAWGIWGGLDVDEREQLAEQHGHPAPSIRPEHGTNPRYAKHGCRCDLCREAHTAYERARRERRRRTGDLWVQPIVLTVPIRTGRRWTCAGQCLLPLSGLPSCGNPDPTNHLLRYDK